MDEFWVLPVGPLFTCLFVHPFSQQYHLGASWYEASVKLSLEIAILSVRSFNIYIVDMIHIIAELTLVP